MHSRLVALGVKAELHVWEGLEHAFFYDHNLPTSREVVTVIVRFFDEQLGKGTTGSNKPTKDEWLAAEIGGFIESDAKGMVDPCQVLFVGSSSIVKWNTLAMDMAPLPVINRGFGGSEIEHVNRWFHRVVAPYHPSTIVFYAGENDIAEGKSPERVVADFDRFMDLKMKTLGDTPVYFISIKPSPLRLANLVEQASVNEKIRKRAGKRTDLFYIDVASQMIENGKPKNIYVEDDLHMNADGYRIWTSAINMKFGNDMLSAVKSCRSGTANAQ